MENKRSKIKVAMNFGAMYGLSTIIVMLLFYFMDSDIQSKAPTWISYLLLGLFMYMGIKSYRDNDQGGFISYGSSVGTGVLISIFGGIITGGFTMILFSFIDPGMGEKIIEAAREQMLEKNMPEDQVEVAMEWTRKMMSPVWLVIWSVVGAAFIGLVFSLIISVFTKKEQNPFQSNIG